MDAGRRDRQHRADPAADSALQYVHSPSDTLILPLHADL